MFWQKPTLIKVTSSYHLSLCLSLPSSSPTGSGSSQNNKDLVPPPEACPEPLWHVHHLLWGALFLSLGPRHTSCHVCPLPGGAAGRHSPHASAGAGLGCHGGTVPAAARQALRDRRELWPGHGLLPVQLSGEAVGVLGLLARPPASAAGGGTSRCVGYWWILPGFIKWGMISRWRPEIAEKITVCLQQNILWAFSLPMLFFKYWLSFVYIYMFVCV